MIKKNTILFDIEWYLRLKSINRFDKRIHFGIS